MSREGFFLEAHVKLRPVDFPSEGMYLSGLAHYPKYLDEAIAQGYAAAARAATVLSKKELWVGGIVAVVDEKKCTGCLTCVRVCPFDVPVVDYGRTGRGRHQGGSEHQRGRLPGLRRLRGRVPGQGHPTHALSRRPGDRQGRCPAHEP